MDGSLQAIRSSDMNRLQDGTAAECGKGDSVQIDERLLEDYAGEYQIGEWNVLTVKRKGNSLFLVPPNGVEVELRPTSETDFESQGAAPPITFDRQADGSVFALRMRMKGGDMAARHIDTATADQVRARLTARIEERKPLPGSAAAVERLVKGLIGGEPNYDEMHPALAHLAKLQLHRLHTAAAHLGAIKSIEFQGVGSQGWDVYDVHHEHGTSRV